MDNQNTMIIDSNKYTVPIEALRMGDNYKDVTRNAIDRLKKSLLEDGQLTPMLVDARNDKDWIVIGGNHQLVAIKELIDEDKWPYDGKVRADLVKPLDDDHAKVLALKHNVQYDLPSNERLAKWGQSLLESEYSLIDIPVMTEIKEVSLLDVIDELGPSKEEPKKDKKPREVVCPKCGETIEI